MALCASLLVGWSIVRHYESSEHEHIHEDLYLQTELMAEIIALRQQNGSADSLQQSISELGRRSDLDITLINLAGEVLADSSANPATLGNQGSMQEVQQALRGSQHWGTAQRQSPNRGSEMLYMAKLIEDVDSPLVIRLAYPLQGLHNKPSTLP